MLPRIHLVLTDDWELRGDGSGNVEQMQFATLRRLTGIYDRYGLKCTFNAEVMQQLQHLAWADRYPHLAQIAQAWDETLLDVYQRGHDVQLHIHCQWQEARYDGRHWQLGDNWALTCRRTDEIRQMLTQCKAYLETLLRRINPAYRCVSFRSGSWYIAPHDELMSLLAAAGIAIDISIVDGLHKSGAYEQDNRILDEAFRPYYPDLRDARRISSTRQAIVCLPTHSFVGSRKALLGRHSSKWLKRLGVGVLADHRACSDAPPDPTGPSQGSEPHQRRPRRTTPLPQRMLHTGRRVASHLSGQRPLISDVANLSYPLMRDMLKDLRARAQSTGWPVVPVVLENHTKDIQYWEPIERLASDLADSPDIEVITLRELANNLSRNAYPIRQRNPEQVD